MTLFKDIHNNIYEQLPGQDISGFLPPGSVEITEAEADAIRAADTPPPEPVNAEPVRIACALRVPVANDEVQVIGGSYRIAAMFFQYVGTFLVVFSQNLGEAEPFVIPNNGVSISIKSWGGDFAEIEVRDHADGNLITPASFGFSLYKF